MRLPAFTLVLAVSAAGATAESAVLAAQRAWVDSYKHRDAKALGMVEADEFHITFGNGSVQRKADQLTRLEQPLPSGAEYAIAVESSDVRVYGDTAVVTGVVVERGKARGQSFNQRSRYTDTWILRSGKWQVVASHLSELNL
jgi:ketosteroid isomerase-like protein